MYIGHIGDSRVYKISNGEIKQITTDHSYVQKLIREGTITEEEAINHPGKNMIMKALGNSDNDLPDILVEPLFCGDIILMCTDGLTNMVTNNKILQTIEEKPEDAHEELVQQAKNNGGMDNITVIIIKNE